MRLKARPTPTTQPDRRASTARPATALLALCLLCVPAACGPRSPDTATGQSTSHRFTLTDEAGVPTATNTGGPKYPTEIFRYERVVELETDEAVYRIVPTRPEIDS